MSSRFIFPLSKEITQSFVTNFNSKMCTPKLSSEAFDHFESQQKKISDTKSSQIFFYKYLTTRFLVCMLNQTQNIFTSRKLLTLNKTPEKVTRMIFY